MTPSAWAHLRFFATDWPGIEAALTREKRTILPPGEQRFLALEMTPPDAVRVVILGQDPYPTPGHAHGLAFSVTPGTTPLPRSLNNIFKELQDDLGVTLPDGDLRGWAGQGVLLLNTALSVPAGEAGGHAGLGWERLTEEVLDEVSRRPTAFILWGRHAQRLRGHIRPGPHLVIESAHPSPLSARRGFFGSRPFSRVNAWLEGRGADPVDWGNRAAFGGFPPPNPRKVFSPR
ncbi:MAG: uracil-DNA glycosylase [Rhodobacteraceae bacterium]|nr:uracil-DNA glycosylase [Paracoccaceae bacterium]